MIHSRPLRLVVTIPAQNEAATIRHVVGTVPRDLAGIDAVDVVVIDDASTDDTAAEARAAGAVVVPMVGRPGLGPVWRLGMERAIRMGADVIVNLDGDGQFDSRDVVRIIEPILANRFDFVTRTRFAGGGPDGHMPLVKRLGNRLVTAVTNKICGTSFTDVSCGFRAYNREAAYRLAQFGRWTYTEECIVYLTSRGLRLMEMPLRVRGEREFGTSRVAGNIFRFGSHLAHILLRALRDGRPLRFFGSIAAATLLPGVLLLGFVAAWWLGRGTTTPFSQLLTVGGGIVTIGVFLAALALLADMVSRHRLIHEELLYLARRRHYATGPTTDLPGDEAMLADLLAE